MEKLLKILAVNIGSLVFGVLFLMLFLTSLASKAGVITWVLLVLFLAVLGLWLFGNYKLFHKAPAKVYQQGELTTAEQYHEALDSLDPKCFKRQVAEAQSQLSRLEQKRNLADDQLRRYFGGSQISLSKYMHTLDGVNSVFLNNLQQMMNRIVLFDYEGYKKLMDHNQEHTAAFIPYQESIAYINSKIADNEKILSAMDHLLLEISKLNDSSQPLENMPAMSEMQDLIQNTKLYKH